MAKEIETCEGTPIIEASDRETLKSKVQSEEFLKFCESVIDFKYYTIVDIKTSVSAHNNKFAWKLFMENWYSSTPQQPVLHLWKVPLSPSTEPRSACNQEHSLCNPYLYKNEVPPWLQKIETTPNQHCTFQGFLYSMHTAGVLPWLGQAVSPNVTHSLG